MDSKSLLQTKQTPSIRVSSDLCTICSVVVVGSVCCRAAEWSGDSCEVQSSDIGTASRVTLKHDGATSAKVLSPMCLPLSPQRNSAQPWIGLGNTR
jgi:hypothetical protein